LIRNSTKKSKSGYTKPIAGNSTKKYKSGYTKPITEKSSKKYKSRYSKQIRSDSTSINILQWIPKTIPERQAYK
jgi:hypothetical protein